MTSFSSRTSWARRLASPPPAGFRAGAQPWRRFLATLGASTAALTFATMGAAFILDPFDTGRPAVFHKAGVRPQGPRTAGASRGRDPAFDAAVIGNSHIQMVSPERLDALTGLSFVQLSMLATGPKEQFVVLDWFLHHHPRPRAVVVSADRFWCYPEGAGSEAAPFPFWLYSRSALEYWRGLLRSRVAEEIPRRIAYLASKRPARAAPDGYSDYEPIYPEGASLTNPARLAAMQGQTDDYIRNDSGRFPAAERLRDVVADLPSETAVVVVFPPTYRSFLPRPGSAGDAANRACKAALAAALGGRTNAAVVDWRQDRPELHDPEQFIDPTHYRRPLAEKLEREIVQALGRTAPAPR